MKWIRRGLVALAALVAAVLVYSVLTALDSARPVGFHTMQAQAANGQVFGIAVWYPSDSPARPTTLLGTRLMKVAAGGEVSGQDLPLIVISHGNGGGPASHADLAMAVAAAGYVVAAPMHTGDNYADQSRAAAATLFAGRVQELRATVDHLLSQWPGHTQINPQQVGAFGFSAGGFSVLAASGGRPDLGRVAAHCRQSQEFVCDVLRQLDSGLLKTPLPAEALSFTPDPRIKAAVLAAPGLGFTFQGLAPDAPRLPIQLWIAEQDERVPYESNGRLVRELPGADIEFHAVPHAGHTAFLVPCGLLAPPALCRDPAPFERTAFHAAMNAEVVAFFDRHIKGAPSSR